MDLTVAPLAVWAPQGQPDRGFQRPLDTPRRRGPGKNERRTMTTAPQTVEVKASETKSFVRIAPHVVRILLGLMFLVFGLNGFLNFMP
jgi:hypothetical protein